MPKYIGAPTGIEHDNQVDRLRAAAGRHKEVAYTYVRYLVDFYISNKRQIQEEKWSPAKIRVRWAADALRCNYAVSTALRILKLLNRYNVDPEKPDEAIERIEVDVLTSGLTRLVGNRKPTNFRVTLTVHQLFAPLRSKHAGRTWQQKAAHQACRTAWYLCVATGCRISHVFDIISVRYTPVGLEVDWGRRKVRFADRAGLMYRFSWSAEPPIDVREHLLSISASSPLRIPHYKDPSTAVLRWVRLHQGGSLPVELCTGDSRTRMCSVLRMAVKDGVIDAEEYTLLMDHLLSTADHSYRVETRDFPDYDPDESDFELGELDG